MRAVYNDDELMLRDLASALADAMAIRNPSDLHALDPAGNWRRLAESGLLSLRESEAGETVGSGTDVQLVIAAMAEKLVAAPVLPSALLSNELCRLVGVSLDDIVQPRSWSNRCGLLLRPDLTTLADVADVADAVGWGVESARYGLALDRREERVVLVELGAAGEDLHSSDATRPLVRAGEPVSCTPIGDTLQPSAYTAWLALALVGVSADTQGVLAAAVRQSIDYAKSREAFGVPIGSFQALQHIIADDYVAADSVETTNCFAAWSIDHAGPVDALLAARTAKAYACQVALGLVEDLMQVLGGIGQTWEHIAHFYVRRVLLDMQLFGSRDVQLNEIYRLRPATRGGTR